MEVSASKPGRADLALTGFFINLDRAAERRQKIESQLDRYGLGETYRRFPAVDGQAIARRGKLTRGELGIFRSHIDVLKQASRENLFLHVLEDDVIISGLLAPVLASAFSRQLFRDLDIVFLDIAVRPDLGSIKTLKNLSAKAFDKPRADLVPADFRIVDVAKLNYFGAASYLVNPRAFTRLLSLFEAEWNRGPNIPVDFFLRQEIAAGRLSGGCVLPFVTTVDLEDVIRSQSGRKDSQDTPIAFGLMCQSFFVDRDLVQLSQMADEFIRRTSADPRDPHYEYLYTLFRFFMFDRT